MACFSVGLLLLRLPLRSPARTFRIQLHYLSQPSWSDQSMKAAHLRPLTRPFKVLLLSCENDQRQPTYASYKKNGTNVFIRFGPKEPESGIVAD